MLCQYLAVFGRDDHDDDDDAICSGQKLKGGRAGEGRDGRGQIDRVQYERRERETTGGGGVVNRMSREWPQFLASFMPRLNII